MLAVPAAPGVESWIVHFTTATASPPPRHRRRQGEKRGAGRTQSQRDVVVLLKVSMTELMIAEDVVRASIRAPRGCGVGVKMRSTMADMALPFVRRR